MNKTSKYTHLLSASFIIAAIIASPSFAYIQTMKAQEPIETNISTQNEYVQEKKLPEIPQPAEQKSQADLSKVQTTLKQTIPQQVSLQPSSIQTKELLIPAHTVLNITLDQEIHSQQAQPGNPVSAVITEPLLIGPYEMIPQGSRIHGKVTHVNAHKDQEGRNPYVMVSFQTIQRPGDTAALPFSGSLIAYKTGMRGQDFVWKLPSKGERKRQHLKSVIGGAISGAFLNPFFGPPVGAGLALLKGAVLDGFARGGDVELKPNQEIPISVDEAFSLPIAISPVEPLETQHSQAQPQQPLNSDSVERGVSFPQEGSSLRNAPLLEDKIK